MNLNKNMSVCAWEHLIFYLKKQKLVIVNTKSNVEEKVDIFFDNVDLTVPITVSTKGRYVFFSRTTVLGVYDLKRRKFDFFLGNKHPITCISTYTDGYVATGSEDGQIMIFEISTGEFAVSNNAVHAGKVLGICSDPHRRLFYSISTDFHLYVTKANDAFDKKYDFIFGAEPTALCRINNDCLLIAVHTTLFMYDTVTQAFESSEILTYLSEGPIVSLCACPDNISVIVGFASGRCIFTCFTSQGYYDIVPARSTHEESMTIAFSANGKFITVASPNQPRRASAVTPGIEPCIHDGVIFFSSDEETKMRCYLLANKLVSEDRTFKYDLNPLDRCTKRGRRIVILDANNNEVVKLVTPSVRSASLWEAAINAVAYNLSLDENQRKVTKHEIMSYNLPAVDDDWE